MIGAIYIELDQALEICFKKVKIDRALIILDLDNSNKTSLNLTITFQNPSKFLIVIDSLLFRLQINEQLLTQHLSLPPLEIPSGQINYLSLNMPVFGIGDPPYKVSVSGTIMGHTSYLFIRVSKVMSVIMDKYIE